MKEYHKEQDIDAPFKNLKSRKLFAYGFQFIFTMQKDLSEWIDLRAVEIDNKVSRELNKSDSE